MTVMIGGKTTQSRRIERYKPKRRILKRHLNPQKSDVYYQFKLSLINSRKEICIPLAFHKRTMTLKDLIPSARQICEATIKAISETYHQAGQPIACETCKTATCCRYLIGLSIPEAIYLVDTLMQQMSLESDACIAQCRQRATFLDQAIKSLNDSTPPLQQNIQHLSRKLQIWHAKNNLKCPFLKQKRCTIYQERPLVCRQWLITPNHEFCLATGVPAKCHIPLPVNLTDVLVETTRHFFGLSEIILLPTIFDWYDRNYLKVMQSFSSLDLIHCFLISLKTCLERDENSLTRLNIYEMKRGKSQVINIPLIDRNYQNPTGPVPLAKQGSKVSLL